MHFSTSLAISALLEFAAAATCPASGPPTYPKATERNNAFIPFINKFPLIDSTPSVTFTVKTKYNQTAVQVKSAGMDTGSTGLMIGAGVLGFDEKTDFDKSQPGNEFLSSSNRLWQGYWIEANITFPARNDELTASEEVVASVPIMVVTEASICKAWNKQGSCTEAQKSNITMYPNDIHYMGVGFGRWSSEQPDAIPSKVTLINIVSIGGQPVDDMHQGYIIGKDGVEVGLTSENTEGFCKTKLGLTPGSKAERDWYMVDMAISINDSPYDHGSALLDTGIAQSFIRVNKDVSSHVKNVTSKFIKTKPPPQVAAKGTVVVVHIPNEKNPIATYNVTAQGAGKPNPATMQPAGYILEEPTPSKPIYINTGRMFYNGFDVLYDSDCGWFGLAELSETSAKRVKRATCPS
ncbi:hypothetical protein CNYM01_10077 [Colletotrichum nymphaeae SA-01]|uniref:Peptidase A1 domain-containing protein n=1 Tax=Colletotrichum nymphaeae SA-01 TaxID=1460502 RepID=A0A135TIZ9_9PEZI|nr:hypothetical protein CNYM01_10077 [Colletotrichum nymphaeae SA-01]